MLFADWLKGAGGKPQTPEIKDQSRDPSFHYFESSNFSWLVRFEIVDRSRDINFIVEFSEFFLISLPPGFICLPHLLGVSFVSFALNLLRII